MMSLRLQKKFEGVTTFGAVALVTQPRIVKSSSAAGPAAPPLTPAAATSPTVSAIPSLVIYLSSGRGKMQQTGPSLERS
jgi:hypothetical protein